ncbi:MAG: hypothetical protein ACQESF_02805 [Nanobdellota archaeon]
MFKQILVVPVFTILFLGFATQLMDVAESASEKTIDFTYDMQNAIDCATRGVDIRECSPGIYEHSFKKEIQQTKELNDEFLKDIRERAAKHNMTIEQKDDILVIH